MSSITILFATEMGNSESCANYVVGEFKKRQLPVKCMNMTEFDEAELANEGLLLIITSTTGDGDPPNDAQSLYDQLTDNALDLSARTFAVLALGDSSYAQFAQCGKDFDRMLGDLGAKRVIDRIDCDVDYEEPSRQFCEQLYAYFATEPDQFPDFQAEAIEEETVEPTAPEPSSPTEPESTATQSKSETRQTASPPPGDEGAASEGCSRSLPRRLLSRVKRKVLSKING